MRIAGGANGNVGGNTRVPVSNCQCLCDAMISEWTIVPQYWPPTYGVSGGPYVQGISAKLSNDLLLDHYKPPRCSAIPVYYSLTDVWLCRALGFSEVFDILWPAACERVVLAFCQLVVRLQGVLW